MGSSPAGHCRIGNGYGGGLGTPTRSGGLGRSGEFQPKLSGSNQFANFRPSSGSGSSTNFRPSSGSGRLATGTSGRRPEDATPKGASAWQALAWPDRFGEPIPVPDASGN